MTSNAEILVQDGEEEGKGGYVPIGERYRKFQTEQSVNMHLCVSVADQAGDDV